MDPLRTAGGTTRDDEKIKIPTCVHAVRPIDLGGEKTQSQLEKVISAYDHIIDTAVAQLQLLEKVDNAAPVPVSAPTKSPSIQQIQKSSAPSKPTSAQPVPLGSKFSHKWPVDLKYPLSVAVKVNSKNIPVTPWLFRRIFGPAVHIRLHKHSSYKGPLPNLVNDNQKEYKLDEIKLIFTVIIHDIEKLEFVVDPLRQGIIRDEQNLQRYLLRLLKIFSPMDPVDDASSEGYVDVVGRGLLQTQQPNLVKKTLGSLDSEVRTRSLLVRPNQPTPADFSLLAASYEHDLQGFAGVESFKSNLETYFGVKADGKQWFKVEA